MAFKRSWVRLPSAPPPFALESQSFGWQADFSPTICRDVIPFESEGCPPKPRRRGTIFFLIDLEPLELRVASHFFTTTICCHGPFRSEGMKYVYLLQSLSVPTQRYVGVTTNLEERLQAHNAGASLYTSKYRPWKVVMYLCFEDDRRAADFERYLKTGSGQAFANKRLW
jgi:putative endonuclease